MMQSRRQVLLVDDDPVVLRVLTRLLESEGYSVRTAADGWQAMEILESGCPDFVVTDWDMPRMDGLDLCRRLRSMDLSRYVYVVILTGKAGPESVVTGLQAGANDFLPKPVCREELVARLRAGERVLELEERLLRLARHDVLTDLPGRRHFLDLLASEFDRARRHGRVLTCAMLDLDFFKRINDGLGHFAGDQVLKEAATLLNEACRPSDVVCRYGGEEFVALLPETNAKEALAWAERVRHLVASHAFHAKGEIVHLTVSIGIAVLDENTIDPERLVDQADQALLVAKQAGRNRVADFGELEDHRHAHGGAGSGCDDPLAGVTARDCMTSPAACLRQDDRISDAADFFVRMRLNSAPVVDADGKLAGILSEKDVLAAMLSPDSWSLAVRELMQLNVVCFDGATPVRRIYDFLCRATIRRVVILEDGEPAGIIDRGSLLRWFYDRVHVSGQLVIPGYATAGRPPLEPVLQTAAALVEEASRLDANLLLVSSPTELAPIVVGRASRMQELLNDLLAYSRLTHRDGRSHLTF